MILILLAGEKKKEKEKKKKEKRKRPVSFIVKQTVSLNRERQRGEPILLKMENGNKKLHPKAEETLLKFYLD